MAAVFVIPNKLNLTFKSHTKKGRIICPPVCLKKSFATAQFVSSSLQLVCNLFKYSSSPFLSLSVFRSPRRKMCNIAED